jgi:CBS domain-containing protein
MTTVRDAMSRDVSTAAATDWVADAAQTMRDEDVGSLPVVDGDHLVAILTDRDIVVRTVAARVDPGTVRVGEIASSELVTVTPDQSVDEAAALMGRHQVRRLPVVEDGRLVGMLAQADVALSADEAEAGEMLAEISQHDGGARETGVGDRGNGDAASGR